MSFEYKLISLFLFRPGSVPIPFKGVATLARHEQHIPITVQVLNHFATKLSINTLSVFWNMRGLTTFNRHVWLCCSWPSRGRFPIPIQGVTTLARREQHILMTALNSQPFRHQTENWLASEHHVHIFQNIKIQEVAGDIPSLNIIVQVWGKHVGGTAKKQTTDDLNRDTESRGLGKTWKKTSLLLARDVCLGASLGLRDRVRRAQRCCLESPRPWHPWTCVPIESPLQDHNPQSSRSHVAWFPVPTPRHWSWFRVTCRVVGPNGERCFVIGVESRLSRAFNTCFRTFSECTIDLHKIVEWQKRCSTGFAEPGDAVDAGHGMPLIVEAPVCPLSCSTVQPRVVRYSLEPAKRTTP